MVKTKKKELMMVSLDKGSELSLSTLTTEGKSPRYIDWLNTRLRFFSDFIRETYGEDFKLQDLTVEDGRAYIGSLIERDARYQNHPMHKRKEGKLKVQYIMLSNIKVRPTTTTSTTRWLVQRRARVP
jgi:hypothetical protein